MHGRRTTRTTMGLLALVSAIALTSLVGCDYLAQLNEPMSPEVKAALVEDAAFYEEKIADFTSTIDELLAGKLGMEEQIADLRAQLAAMEMSDEDRAKAEATVVSYEAILAGLDERTAWAQGHVATLQGWAAETAEKIKAAETPADALGATVQTTGTAIAAFAGPYAPHVLLATNVIIPTFLQLFSRRKRQVAVGAVEETAADRFAKLVGAFTKAGTSDGNGNLIVDKARLGDLQDMAGIRDLVRAVRKPAAG